MVVYFQDKAFNRGHLLVDQLEDVGGGAIDKGT
jgi:hypothetical protein